MVITKGSGRIAEVTARFTLDAMPGKQMSIDAEMNSGSSLRPKPWKKGSACKWMLIFTDLWMVPVSSLEEMPLRASSSPL